MESFNEAFQGVLKYCEADPSVSEIGFNKWIRILEPFKLENNTAFLLTDSEFTKKTTMEVYEDVLKKAFLEILGFSVDIRILVKAKEEKSEELLEEPAPTVSAPPQYSSSLTFENFVKGKSNELA